MYLVLLAEVVLTISLSYNTGRTALVRISLRSLVSMISPVVKCKSSLTY